MNNIPLDRVLPNPDQPRKNFEPEALNSLAQSIRENGVLQPVLVEESDGMYILYDGERRTRAARIAGLTEIPAMIIPPQNGDGSKSRLIKALAANIQRSDLNPIEEARAYMRLMEEGKLSVRRLSEKTGIYEARIHSLLMILKLDPAIQELIAANKFTHQTSVIRQLLDIPDSAARIDLCQKLAAKGLGKNGKAVVNSSKLLINRLKDKEQFKAGEAPSLHLAQKTEKADLPKWDILFQAGKVPSWSTIYTSALETCNACPRRPAASEVTCSSCLAVSLLARIIQNGNREKAHNLAVKVVRQRASANGR